MNQCSAFMNENSYGLTSFNTTVTPCFVLPQNEAYYKTNGDFTLQADARAVAKANGFDYATYDLDAVRWNGGPGGYGGQAYVGWRGCWLKSSSTGVAAHEFGHNYGLWHANYWSTNDGTTIGAGSNQEYGDPFDTMGAAGAGAQHFNAFEKNVLQWIPAANVSTLTASGQYRVYAHDTATTTDAGKFYGLTVAKDADRVYWIDLRQKFTGNAWQMNGAGLHWDSWASSNSGSQLLDTTPGSASGKNDSAIVIGRTFSDSAAGIHITPVGKGGTTPESLDVVVNIGAFAGNNAPVIASLNCNPTAPALNTAATLTCTASDPNGDTLAYSWDFGDGSFSTNNAATQSKTWSSATNFTVQCTVSDRKGMTATSSITVSIIVPGTYTVSGNITSSGVALAGVVVGDGTRSGSSDSLGNYTIFNVPNGTYTLSPVKSGCMFTPSTLSVTVASANLSGKNFTATVVPPPGNGPGSGITREWFLGIGGTAIADLTSNAAFPNSPSGTETVTTFFEGPTNVAESYGTRMRGFFIAPTTGNYFFSIASDDNGELWLSTNTDPANKSRIARVDSWTNSREWNRFASQRSTAIALTAGQRYYIEALMKEGGGGDNLAVGVELPYGFLEQPIPYHRLDPIGGTPTSKLAFTVQPSSAATNATIAPAVTVAVQDSNGSTITSATNSITLAIAANPGSGTLAGTLTASAVNGVATFSSLSINNAGNGYTLSAAATGLTGATSTSFNINAVPTKLAFSVQPVSSNAGATITPAVKVAVQDASGNTITSATHSITLAIAANPASGTLAGTLTALAVNGVATFSNLSINNAGNGYTLSAAAAGLTGATSSTFNINAVATNLAFTVQPVSTNVGATITPAVKVAVQDSKGNTITSARNSITLAIAANPASGTLAGTLTVDAANGVATFSNLSINSAGNGYTLSASAQGSGLTGATSNTFNINPVATKLAFTLQPSGAAAGATIAPAIKVAVQDVNGNTMSGATNSITLAFGNNAGSGTLAGTLAAAAVNGVATFSNLSINNPGNGYTLNATAANLTGATSSAFNITPVAGNGDGLAALYFNNADLTGTSIARIDPTINFAFGGGSPDAAIGADTFSARWTGKVQAQYTETYTFYALADDGVRLWVNNVLLIDKWIDQGPTEYSATITVAAGTKYDIKMEYYENGGGADARLFWSSPSTAKSIVPQSQLFSGGLPATVAFAAASSSGSEAITSVNLAVALNAASTQTVTVAYAITGGTATNGGIDYKLADGTVSFAPGETTKNISFSVTNDTLNELNETIVLNLNTPLNATLGIINEHTYTITDDDLMPAVAFTSAASSDFENHSPAVITVSLNAPSAQAVTVGYSVTGGSAISGTDFFALTGGTVTFDPGETSATFTLSIVDDNVKESDETVELTLSAPINASLGAQTVHIYTIRNDDNVAPVAVAGAYTTTKGVPVSGKLNASDSDADPLTYSIVKNGSLGSAVITNASTGAFTYTPRGKLSGTDTFFFKATDGSVDSNVAVITITIKNIRPVASGLQLATLSTATANGSLIATDDDGDVLIYSLVGSASLGTINLDSASGQISYVPIAGGSGIDALTYVVSDGDETSDAATFTVSIKTPLEIISALSATPAVAGEPVTFSCAANANGLNWAWDFGDGSSAPGSSSATHTYAAAGLYPVTVVASANGESASASMVLVVAAKPDDGSGSGGGGGSGSGGGEGGGGGGGGGGVLPPGDLDGDGIPNDLDEDVDGDGMPNALDTDSDNDGVSDDVEIAMGTDPLDPTSYKKVPMTVSKLAAKLNFTGKGKDKLQIKGVLPSLPALFNPLNKIVLLDVGGATVQFTLNAKGKAQSPQGTAQFKLKPMKKNKLTQKKEFMGGAVPFTIKLSKVDLSSAWLDEGVDPESSATNAAISVNIDLNLNGTIYTSNRAAHYTAKAKKGGKLK